MSSVAPKLQQMECSNKVFRLLEIIYVKAVECKIQNIRRELCCGCKVYDKDCLMMTEEEGWEMHGLAAIKQVNSQHLVWHEFTNVLGTLNFKVHEDFAKYLAYLQEYPDLRFVKTLMYTYQDNQPLLQTLNELSTWNSEINPLESCAQCHFSSPARYVKGTGEKSHETDHNKAYWNYLENKLKEHFSKLF